MKKILDITKPRYSEQILPVPWPFVISRLNSISLIFMSSHGQGLRGRGGGGEGEVTSHPGKLKPATISGGNDSDLPKVLHLMPLPDIQLMYL